MRAGYPHSCGRAVAEARSRPARCLSGKGETGASRPTQHKMAGELGPAGDIHNVPGASEHLLLEIMLGLNLEGQLRVRKWKRQRVKVDQAAQQEHSWCTLGGMLRITVRCHTAT